VSGTPILYAALGELITEKAGVTNLGVEGMMLVGAVSGFMTAILSGNSWLGLLAALLAGGLMGLIHAVLTVSLRPTSRQRVGVGLVRRRLSGNWARRISAFPWPSHSGPSHCRFWAICRFWGRCCSGMTYWSI
jgi:simple sugar transport system permease protein